MVWFLWLGAALAQPDNDTFNNRTVLTGNRISILGTTVDATRDRFEADITGALPGQSVVWWQWTAPVAGPLSLQGGQLMVFEGTDAASLRWLGGSQSPESPPIPVKAGQGYCIALLMDYWPGSAFQVELALPVAPLNDSVATPADLSGDWVEARGTLLDATPEFGWPTERVWWRWTAPRNGWASLRSPQSASGLGFDVWRGDQDPAGTPQIADSRFQMDDVLRSKPGVPSFTWPVESGLTYLIAAKQPIVGLIQDFDFRLTVSSIAAESDRERLAPGESARISIQVPSDMALVWRRALLFGSDGSVVTNLDWTTPILWLASRRGAHQLEVVLEDSQGRRWPSMRPVPILVRDADPPLVNDRFDERILLPARTNLEVDPRRATMDPGEPSPEGGSLWFEWKAAENGRMLISLPLYSLPALRVSAFLGTELDVLKALPLEVITNKGFLDWHAPVMAGQRGVLRIASELTPPGGTIIMGFAIGPIPVNDEFSSRSEISAGSFRLSVDNALALREPGEPPGLERSIWYEWTAPTNGTLSLRPPPTRGHQLVVYSGSDWPPGIRMGEAAGGGTRHSLYFVNRGDVLVIQVGSQDSSLGNGFYEVDPFELEGAFAPRPSNENLASPTILSGVDLRFPGNLAGARQPPARQDLRQTFRYLWYEWQAGESGEVLVSLPVAFGGDVVVDELNPLERTLLTRKQPGQWVFTATQGSRYRLGIGNSFGGPDAWEAELRVRRPEVHDSFARRLVVSGPRAQLRGTPWGSSIEPEEAVAGVPASGSLWWTWKAPQNGWVALRSSELRTIRVFTGSMLDSLSAVPVSVDPLANGFQEARFDAVAGTSYHLAMYENSQSPFDFIVDLDFSTLVISTPRPGDFYLHNGDARVTAEAPDPEVDGVLTGPVSVVRHPAESLNSILGILPSLPGVASLSGIEPPEIGFRLRGTNTSGEVRLSRPIRALVRPGNDAFSLAQWVSGTNGVVQFPLSGATFEPGEPEQSGVSWGSVWFLWQAPATGHAWFRGSGSYDQVHVFQGSDLTLLREVTGWVDRDGMAIPVERSAVYAIQVSGSATGNLHQLEWESWPFRIVVPGPNVPRRSEMFIELLTDLPAEAISEVSYDVRTVGQLGPVHRPPWRVVPWYVSPEADDRVEVRISFWDGSWIQSPTSVPLRWRPDNDDVADAIDWPNSFVTLLSTGGATRESGEPDVPQDVGTLWWRFEAPDDGYVRMTTANESYPLEAFLTPRRDSWSGAVRVAEPGVFHNLPVERGRQYLFRLRSPRGGSVSLSGGFSREGANRTPETAPNLAGDGGALIAEFAPATSSDDSRFWWIVPDRSGVIYLERRSTSEGVCFWRLHPEGVRDDVPTFLWPNHYEVEQGGRYLLEIRLAGSPSGAWRGAVKIQDANDNDRFSRSWMAPPEGLQRTFFLGATPSDPAEPVLDLQADPSTLRSLWFTWTSPMRQYVTFRSSVVAPLAVFEGGSWASLWPITRSDWVPITFLAEAGRSYSLLLQQAGSDGSGIEIGIEPIPPPEHDDFERRGLVHGFDATITFDCHGATREWHEPAHGSGSSWWTWTAPATGRVRLQRESGGNNLFDLSVYRGSTLTTLMPVAGTVANPGTRLLEVSVKAGEDLQFAGASWWGGWFPFLVPEIWHLEFLPELDPVADLQLVPLDGELEVRWPAAYRNLVLEFADRLKNPSWQSLDKGSGTTLRQPLTETGVRFFRMRPE